MLDRIIGTGVAAHEGQLFGWVNQVLGVLTALGLITLSISALILWWQRRPAGVLGAQAAVVGERIGLPLVGPIILFGVLLPMLGLSLIAVLVIERELGSASCRERVCTYV